MLLLKRLPRICRFFFQFFFFSFQQFIPLVDEIPPGFDRLDEGEELCVPKSWMCLLLCKCKGRCPSFTFKKMMDSFFEPEEMKDRKAVEFASKDKIMKDIKSKMLYMLVFIQKNDPFFLVKNQILFQP